MWEETSCGTLSRTESLISKARLPKNRKPLILHPQYLDDEQLPDEERTQVLQEIFTRDVRDNELYALASHYAPLLDGKPSNHALICGPTGSGKTASILHFLASMQTSAQREQIPFHWFFVELSAQSTCFAALNRMAVALDASKAYYKGIPIELMQTRICDAIRSLQGTCVFFMDEIDNVVTDRNMFMTYLVKSLPRQVPVRLVYIFTTNRLDWDKTLDARILSCMRKHDLIFDPYDANEIEKILHIRINKALDREQVDEGAISLISAISSRDSGDARKAVELLSKAAMIAERDGISLTQEAVQIAEKNLEEEKTIALAQSLPFHQKVCLIACYSLGLEKKHRMNTGEVYDVYRNFIQQLNRTPLSQRRFSDILGSLDLYGLINARLVSHGRYGKTREIENPVNRELIVMTVDRLKRILFL